MNKSHFDESKYQQLHTYNAELKYKYIEHSKLLINVYQELILANQDIEIFLYKAYHNFLGPIATIQGLCNVAQMEIHEPAALDYFEKVRLVSDNMHIMLDKFLEISSIHDQELNIEQFALQSFFLAAEQEIQTIENMRNLRFKCSFPDDLNINADTFLLNKTLVNILKNTLSFRNKARNKIIEPIIFCTDSQEYYIIEMLDYNLHIPSEVSENIFKMFNRSTYQSGDHGLGLYSAKFAMRRMGGDISMQANINHTIFTLKLPKFMLHLNKIEELNATLDQLFQNEID